MIVKILLYLLALLAVLFVLLIALLVFSGPIIRFFSSPKDLKASRANGRQLEAVSGKTILTVVAHPDDVDFYAGGTLALLAKKNRVVVVVGTSGEKGGRNHDGKLPQTREAEQRKAGKILGYDELIFLRHPDRELKTRGEFQGELVEIMKKEKPEVLFTFDTEKEGLIYRHSDHRASGRASIAALKEYRKESGAKPVDVYLFHTSEPNTVTDIESVLDPKSDAMEAHESQRDLPIRKLFRFIPRSLQDRQRRGFAANYPDVGIEAGEVYRKTRVK